MADTTPPQLNQVYTPAQRSAAGIGIGYADTYNDAQLAKYNNEYNYWLWQQQMAYNSPSAQVQRLKDAGLNPNYNSIEGAGNVSSIPSSTASFRSHGTADRMSMINSAIGGVQSFVSNIGTLVDSVSKLSNIPKDWRTTRYVVQDLIENKRESATLDTLIKRLQYHWDNYQVTGKKGFYNSFGANGELKDYQDVEAAPKSQIQKLQMGALGLLNELREQDLTQMKPAEWSLIKERINLINEQLNLMNKQEQSLGKSNGWYNSLVGSGHQGLADVLMFIKEILNPYGISVVGNMTKPQYKSK